MNNPKDIIIEIQTLSKKLEEAKEKLSQDREMNSPSGWRFYSDEKSSLVCSKVEDGFWTRISLRKEGEVCFQDSSHNSVYVDFEVLESFLSRVRKEGHL